MTKERSSGKKTGIKYRRAIAVLLLIWFSVGVLQNGDSIFPFLAENIGAGGDSHIIPASEEWNLVVVNRWNEIPENYSASLTELSNGQKVDSRIYPCLQEMFDAMRIDGIYPIVEEVFYHQICLEEYVGKK